jgi:hypothetical protein
VIVPQVINLHKRSKQHLRFCMDPLVVRKVPLIRHHHHLVLANRGIWIRMSVKVENHHVVLMKAYTSELGEISKKSKDLILSIKQTMLMRKPDVRCKNLRGAREWEIMDFGRFAFGNFTILICFWVVTCLFLAMRNMSRSACTFGMFQDRYIFHYCVCRSTFFFLHPC